MNGTWLSHPFFTEQVLPFLLVFTLIFAILEKTKILGEAKRQIDAIVAFVIGLILIAFPFPRYIVVSLMPLLAVIAVILLVFMILYGFASGEKEFKIPKKLTIGFGILIAIVLVIALLVLTDYWYILVENVLGGSELVTNIFFIVVIVVGIALVLCSGKKGESSSST